MAGLGRNRQNCLEKSRSAMADTASWCPCYIPSSSVIQSNSGSLSFCWPLQLYFYDILATYLLIGSMKINSYGYFRSIFSSLSLSSHSKEETECYQIIC